MKRVLHWTLFGLLMLLGGCASPTGPTTPPATPELDAGVWNAVATGGDTACADGSKYGFFAYAGKTNKLVIDFRGGGACWNYFTCSQPSRPGRSGGYYFNQVFGPPNGLDGKNRGIYDHDNAANPVKDWYHVHIPYCTGDIHYGENIKTYMDPQGPDVTVQHKGAVNTRAVLDWVYKEFEAPEEIFVTGCSAGAYGSILWTPYLEQHYPKAKIHQLGDCGAGVITPEFAQEATANWNVDAALPDFVPGLDPKTELVFGVDFTQKLYQKIAQAYPNSTFSQYNTVFDSTQIGFYSLMRGQAPGEVGLEWSQKMQASLATIRAGASNFTSFTDDLKKAGDPPNATQHCAIIYDDLYTAEQGGVKLTDWLTTLLSGTTPAPVGVQ
ncbi:pectin acetylesterase-family hydrolase [soil metagenome]